MPVGKLEFNLPEELGAFEAAQQGDHLRYLVDDVYAFATTRRESATNEEVKQAYQSVIDLIDELD
jgi:hypothetical protein